jgi:hypothetical protein
MTINRGSLQRALAMVLVTLAALIGFPAQADSPDVAMVTLLQGKASRSTPQGSQPVQAFTKLRHGDLMTIERGARLQIVYFDGGRQETWQGGGRLEVAKMDSTPFGLAPPAVKVLPAVVVKQIAKTPALDSQGRAGMLRVRAVGAVGDATTNLANIEASYERMRQEADRDDLHPELYLLSALFELRQLDRLEQALAGLQRTQAGNPAVDAVVARYSKALQGARESARQ